jgi:hypothetical protein
MPLQFFYSKICYYNFLSLSILGAQNSNHRSSNRQIVMANLEIYNGMDKKPYIFILTRYMPMRCTGHIFFELNACAADGRSNGYPNTDHHVAEVVGDGGREA